MDSEPELPIPISLVAGKCLVFDINVVTWLRRTYHMCGVMSGTLPQSPSQNIFLGLPVQIMPEEAQFLIDRGAAYIVDDVRAHDQAMQGGDPARHADYMANVRRKAEQISKIKTGQMQEKKRVALSKQKAKKAKQATQTSNEPGVEQSQPPQVDENDTSLFDTPSTPTPSSAPAATSLTQHATLLTPTTSHLFLSENSNPTQSLITVPNLPPSYPLYAHLNSKSYFLTPGLRFGCQYCVYPGDPLRFHSHFLAVGVQWDEEIDLMDVVGGGRLGTGVKKGWLLGGEEPILDGNGEVEGRRVRTFSVEWAVM